MKRKEFIALVTIVLMMTTSVRAAEFNAMINGNGVVISGKDMSSNRPTLILFKKTSDADITEVTDPAIIKRAVQVTTDNKGAFITPLVRFKETGIQYTAIIKTVGGTLAEEYQFYIIAESEKASIYGAFSAAATKQAMQDFFESYAYKLNIDITSINSYSHPDRIYNLLVDERKSVTDADGIAQVFYKVMKDAKAIEKLNASSLAEFVNVLQSENDRFDLPLTAKWGFAALIGQNGEVSIKEVYNALHKLEYVSELKEKFATAVALEVFNAVKYQDMLTVIKENASAFQAMHGGAFDRLDDNYKYTIFREIRTTGKIFLSIDEVLRYLNNAAEEYNSEADKKGGGNGGGKTSVYAPAVTNPQIPSAESERIDIALPFDDLGEVSWAKESIGALYSKGVINGVDEHTFSPNVSVKREEFMKMLIIAFDAQVYGAVTSFADIPRDSWCYSYIASGQSIGIATGQSMTRFGIGQKLTRQDAATLLYRMLENVKIELAANSQQKQFADSDQFADYAKIAISMLQQAGIIDGKGGDKFAPYDYITRAEAAKMIYSVLAVYERR